MSENIKNMLRIQIIQVRVNEVPNHKFFDIKKPGFFPSLSRGKKDGPLRNPAFPRRRSRLVKKAGFLPASRPGEKTGI
ncbi:Uncharacterized protein dnm_059870 [Desulfonema magnum]|uniref:Uncharacterized protein n=1 Tax=Desulfonema magnum TaxID=45655 RepID=A0A975BR87_9BACT|nr:Uncharacterized protein dnm_059870 [Desulfonema magnum]